MTYGGVPDRGQDRPPSVCKKPKPPILPLIPPFTLGVTAVGGGSFPYTRQAYLYQLNIAITDSPPVTTVNATWINAIAPTSFTNPSNNTGYLGPTLDGVVGVTLSNPNGKVYGTVYASPPGHPHPAY